MFYELRYFNSTKCFHVSEFNCMKKATEVFDDAVSFAAKARKDLVSAGLPADVVASQIQLVARDEFMTALEEVYNWEAQS